MKVITSCHMFCVWTLLHVNNIFVENYRDLVINNEKVKRDIIW